MDATSNAVVVLTRFAQALLDGITGNFAASAIRTISASFTSAGVEISFGAAEKKSVDARIARLDEARAALAEGLGALDELREEAKRARSEHADVVAALGAALANRDDAEKKLEAIRSIISQDVNAFRAVAGVSDVRKERLIGFVSGVCASVVASALWSWGPTIGAAIGTVWHHML